MYKLTGSDRYKGLEIDCDGKKQHCDWAANLCLIVAGLALIICVVMGINTVINRMFGQQHIEKSITIQNVNRK